MSSAKPEKGKPVSSRTVLGVANAAIFGIACVSTDAFAYRGGARGGRIGTAGMHSAGVYHGGGAYRGGYGRPGWGAGAAAVGAAAIGAAAVGAALGAPYYYDNYYDSAQCGYAPYPPCY
jgi:hypothetical protein